MRHRGWQIQPDRLHGSGWLAVRDAEARGPFRTESRARRFVDRCLAESPGVRLAVPPGQLALPLGTPRQDA